MIELFVNLTVNREMYRYKHRFFIINKHVTDIWLGQRSTYPQLISDLLDWETSYSLLWPGKRSSDKIRINWAELALDLDRDRLSKDYLVLFCPAKTISSKRYRRYVLLNWLSNPLLFHLRKFGLGSGTFFSCTSLKQSLTCQVNLV